MQVHKYSIVVDASPDELWAAMHPCHPKLGPGEKRVIVHGTVRIEILNEGDEHGHGLVRHCWFRVPHYLLSGGRSQSWEMVSVDEPGLSSRYDAIGKPLWSQGEGRQRYEDLGDGRTRVHFRETYHVFNPIMRALLERRVHRFISKDNDRLSRPASRWPSKPTGSGCRASALAWLERTPLRSVTVVRAREVTIRAVTGWWG